MVNKYKWVVALFCLTACGDVNLPPVGVETDLNKIPLPENNTESLMEIPLKPETEPMLHKGALHTQDDFDRVKENAEKDPWKTGLEILRTNRHAQLEYVPNPQESIKRGVSGDENYSIAMNDVAAAYQLGLRFRLGDGDAYGDKVIEILGGWADKCTLVTGNTNMALAFGLYGYEFAVAGEQIRDYWLKKDPIGFAAYQQWMVNVFYPGSHDFFVNHFGTPADHYWANWGLCNVASMMAVGILADRRDIYNEAVEHFQVGETNGRMTEAIIHVFDGEHAHFAQWQESGRDAGHVLLCQGLMGTICQLTWNQGDDFFGYQDNLYLKACEYNGCYFVAEQNVPFHPYTREYKGNWGVAVDELNFIAERTGNKGGPIWALAYNHYAKIKGVDASKCKYTKMGMEVCFPEGGGGNYGSNSGGFDHLGFGTLMYSR